MNETIYAVTEPFFVNGIRYELEAIPVLSLSAKIVKVKACRASRYRKQISRDECHFSAEAALRAKEAEVKADEQAAAAKRAALTALRATLTGGPAKETP